MIDFTTVCAVDERYIGQMEMTWPTWKRNRPELFQKPLRILRAVELPDDRLDFVRKDHPDVQVHPIPLVPHLDQRARMLTAFIQLAPWVVLTPWFFKLDVDTVAKKKDSGWCADWLVEPRERRTPEGDVESSVDDYADRPVFTASGWSYTKPASAVATLDAWGNTHPEIKDFPPLNLPWDAKNNKVMTPGRVASFTYFGETKWHRWLAGLCRELPVPSQDTFAWYVAARTRRWWRCKKMKSFGWDTGRPRGLEALVASCE